MKVMLAVMPFEGEVRDRVTAKFYKNRVVKYMPLGVLSVAACCRGKHEVRVLDAASLGLDIDETVARIEEYAPDVLGLSVVTYRAWAMVEILRRTSAPIKAVGGPHATRNAANILRQGAHAVFVGDAEYTFPKWLDAGCPAGTFTSEPVPLDALPFPARDMVPLGDYYIEEDENLLFNVGKLRLPMYSSKGCPFSCVYCDVQQKTFNFKSGERCAEEFEELISMGTTSVHILDDAFNVRKDRVESLCDALIKRGVRVDWSARGTVEIRESVVAKLAEAGCKRLHVGIEHLDDDVLAWFKKSSRYKHIKTFADLCRKHGITILGYFIMGAPVETEEYRRTLPQRIVDLGIKLPYFNVLTPLAETPYYDSLRASGQIPGDPWAEFAANPTPDFTIPYVRSEEEEAGLHQLVDGYVRFFQRQQEREHAC